MNRVSFLSCRIPDTKHKDALTTPVLTEYSSINILASIPTFLILGSHQDHYSHKRIYSKMHLFPLSIGVIKPKSLSI